MQYTLIHSGLKKLRDMLSLNMDVYERFYLNNEISVKVRIIRSLAR